MCRWSGKNKSIATSQLKNCIDEILKEADNNRMKTVAMPAISCGVYGGDPHICCKIIVDVIHEYFINTPASSISSVNILTTFVI